MVITLRATTSEADSAGRAASEAPQLRQNFAVGVHGLPQDGQRRSIGAPHSSQNAEPARFSWRHAAQLITRCRPHLLDSRMARE
jgi:hypothetical protein